MRFTGATIGQGDTIDAASIQLRAAIIAGTIPTTYIEGEDADDAATFTTSANYDGRARTSAVSWTPGAWVDNTWYTSSELKTLLQAIVNRGGWAGDGVVFFWRYDVLGWGGVQKVIGADNYDADTTWAAKLDLDYTAGGAGVTVLAALATASALGPAAVIQTGLLVAGALATATALALAAKHVNTIPAAVATASAKSYDATIVTAANIAAALATATAKSYAATIVAGDTVIQAAIATASALAYAATHINTIPAAVSTATATSLAATVSGVAVIAGALATATARSWDATVSGAALIAAALATATAKSYAAVINPGATIAGALARATALAHKATLVIDGVIAAPSSILRWFGRSF